MTTPVESITGADISDNDAERILADAVAAHNARDTGDTGDTGSTSDSGDSAVVRKLRDENAKRRVSEREARDRLETLQARLKEYEDAELSNQELLQKELEELRVKSTEGVSRAQEAELNYQIALAVTNEKSGIRDAKAAVRLLDRSTLEFDDNHNILNLSEVLDNLKTEFPMLDSSKVITAPNTGVTNPSRTPGTKKITREELKGLSPAKIKELHEAGELNHLLNI